MADSESMTRSSANERDDKFKESIFIGKQVLSKILCISFTNRLKSRGLRLQPCFTPTFDLIGGENSPLFFMM